jgi:hypothetical protein
VIRPAGEVKGHFCQTGNVLTLDYVDVEAGGETQKSVYFYAANQFAFRKNGLDRNPWDSAVQFKDELIRKTFPADSGFTVRYRFVVEEKVPAFLRAIVERADLYTVTLNGKPVKPGSPWRLARSFHAIPLDAVKTGENVLTLRASPFTILHEIEPIYLYGSFTLKPAPSGFVIVPYRGFTLGPWNEQGYPFLSERVRYYGDFELQKPEGRYRLALPEWYGSVAVVYFNGKAGIIESAPWELDVTDRVKPGRNACAVFVYGTLKNQLGPHHNGPGLGTAWPRMFQRAPRTGPPPGEQYATVGYGLFKPFVLKQITTE